MKCSVGCACSVDRLSSSSSSPIHTVQGSPLRDRLAAVDVSSHSLFCHNLSFSSFFPLFVSQRSNSTHDRCVVAVSSDSPCPREQCSKQTMYFVWGIIVVGLRSRAIRQLFSFRGITKEKNLSFFRQVFFFLLASSVCSQPACESSVRRLN